MHNRPKRNRNAACWPVRANANRSRLGAASVDYVLILGLMFTIGGFVLHSGSKIIVLVYDMVCAFVGWPFL